MRIRGAFIDGLARVWRARWLVLGIWATTIVVALPPALLLREAIAAQLGDSLAAASLARGIDLDWWSEFLAQSTGLGQSFRPAIIGFAAVLDNASRIADAEAIPPVVGWIAAAYVLLSLFLAGGIVDRLARDRRVGAAAFFSACGVWFFRLLRLGAIAAVIYWWLFTAIHPLLFDTVYPAWTHEVTEERVAFAMRMALYVPFTLAVCVVNLLFDYAKIRAIVEDRRSMIGALTAGARFVIRHPAQTLGLYALDTALHLGVIAIYFLIAPGASAHVMALVIGQVYIVLRVAVRLQFVASQTALFQSKLAHAGYVAAPVPRWPDSPAAQAILPQ
ncbi:MAG: hypothetical protein IT178_01445 [Acidobacteria bacterium]|nr:hypothetical protein [Acidobacteriota bacterium]